MLNDKDNFIKKLSNMSKETLEKVNFKLYLVQKAATLEEGFLATEQKVDSDIAKEAKEKIQQSINYLKEQECGKDIKEREFLVEKYNDEIVKKDFIANLSIEEDKELERKIKNLKESLRSDGLEGNIRDVKFQVIQLKYGKEEAYFFFYRGLSTESGRKKKVRVLAMKKRETFVLSEDIFLEIGGNIEIFLYKNHLYIVNPRTLEYTFDYRQHIERKRDDAIDRIVKMDFFGDIENITYFRENARSYRLSRKLAQIEENEFDTIEKNFGNRCEEIKGLLETEGEDNKILSDLKKHLDLDNKKIAINQNEDIQTLIDFFAHKIKIDFITKAIET